MEKIEENVEEVKYGRGKGRKPLVTNLIAYFENAYTKEELEAAINLIEEQEYRELVYRICGPELDGVSEDSEKENTKAFNVYVMPRLRARLSKLYPDRKNIAMTTLKQRQKTNSGPIAKMSDKLIASKKGFRGKKVVDETDPVVEVVQPIQPVDGVVVKDEKGLTSQNYRDIRDLLNGPIFAELLKMNYTVDEIVVISLFCDKKLSVEEITKFLGVTEEYVVTVAKRWLSDTQAYINNQFNSYLLSLEK